MPINFLDNVQLNQNQLLGARLQVESANSNVASPVSGQLIYNSTSNKVNYYNGTGWISVPDGTGIGGSGTVNTIPVFTSTGEIGDSRLETSGQTSSATFTFQTTGLTTFVGDVKVSGYLELAAGLKDKDGDLGTSGQLLSSTGTATNWINAPASYTSWALSGDSGSGTIVNASQVSIRGTNGITTSLINPTGNIFVLSSNLNEATSTTRGGIELFSNTDQLVSANSVSATANRTYGIQLNPIGQAVVNVPWTNTDTNTTYSLSTSSTSQGIVDIILDASAGTDTSVTLEEANSSSVQIARDASGNIEFSLRNNVTVPGDLTVGGGDISLTGTGRIQGVDTVTAATDAANKQYVDNAVVGGFNVKGGFNANTGTTAVAGTDLYTNTAVAVGDYYVVTTAGNFFGNSATPLTVGDSVLAQTAAASGNAQESNFAVMQSDTDLATLTTVGLGNVNEATTPNLYGIDVQYSTGTASVGLDINGLSAYSTSSSYPDDDYLVIYASDDGTAMDKNMKVSLTDLKTALSVKGSFSGTSSSATSHVFIHNLGTYNVVVQIFDTSSKETIYASVDRNSPNKVTVTTASSASITCLIQEV